MALFTGLSSAAFFPNCTAASCTSGLNYCGYNLLAKGDYFQSIYNALKAKNKDTCDDADITQSLFECRPNSTPLVKKCRRCRDGGSGNSDSCY
ncbi:hypothetical protein V8F20_009710 [Naviculisporaceae sp. PSN 640]